MCLLLATNWIVAISQREIANQSKYQSLLVVESCSLEVPRLLKTNSSRLAIAPRLGGDQEHMRHPGTNSEHNIIVLTTINSSRRRCEIVGPGGASRVDIRKPWLFDTIARANQSRSQ